MKRILAALALLSSCTTIQPSIDPYLSPGVEKEYDLKQVDQEPEEVSAPPLPRDTAISIFGPGDYTLAPPTANAGPDDTLYFPAKSFRLKGTCTNATTRQWSVLRTSLPASGKDTMTVDIYKIYIDFRFSCKNSIGQVAYDDKRVVLLWEPKDVLATFDAGTFGKWVVTNDGTPAMMFRGN